MSSAERGVRDSNLIIARLVGAACALCGQSLNQRGRNYKEKDGASIIRINIPVLSLRNKNEADHKR